MMKTDMGTVAQAPYRREFKSSHYREMFPHVIQGWSLKQQAEMWKFTVQRAETKSQPRGEKCSLVRTVKAGTLW